MYDTEEEAEEEEKDQSVADIKNDLRKSKNTDIVNTMRSALNGSRQRSSSGNRGSTNDPPKEKPKGNLKPSTKAPV